MMIEYGNQEYMKKWLSRKIGGIDPGLCASLGVVKENELICVVLYNNFICSPKGEPISIEAHIASIDKSWCTRHNLRILLSYPFMQLGVKRVQATVSKRNKDARRFLQKLGFKYEGTGRKAWPLGGDSCCYSMLFNECRWL